MIPKFIPLYDLKLNNLTFFSLQYGVTSISVHCLPNASAVDNVVKFSDMTSIIQTPPNVANFYPFYIHDPCNVFN